jgi:hypothetical protein
LTSASSAFVAAADAMFKVDLQNSISFTRKLFYRLEKFFKWKLTKINDISDYLDPGKKIISCPCHVMFNNTLEKKCTNLITYFVTTGKFNWWSPTTGGDPVELNFVDGGLFDNLGALALLRRRCSTIIVCMAADTDVLDVVKPEKLHEKHVALSALFGRGASLIPGWAAKKGYKDTVNERSRVFAYEELDSLMEEVRALRKQGKPLVVRKKLQVLPNALAGIYESYWVA